MRSNPTPRVSTSADRRRPVVLADGHVVQDGTKYLLATERVPA
ncbi:hypothetical protein [Dietzia sp. 111N12-1]|nr:hypothetical protein [Dietzia sp. 111N12-1]